METVKDLGTYRPARIYISGVTGSSILDSVLKAAQQTLSQDKTHKYTYQQWPFGGRIHHH